MVIDTLTLKVPVVMNFQLIVMHTSHHGFGILMTRLATYVDTENTEFDFSKKVFDDEIVEHLQIY